MRLLLLLCLALAATACEDRRRTPDAAPARAPADAGASLAPPAPIEQPAAAPADAAGDAQAFWTEFRAAAVARDTARLKALTRFPFTTRGSMDWHPVIEHRAEEFGPLILTLLEKEEIISVDEVLTQRQLIERAPVLDEENLRLSREIGWFRVADLEFRRGEDGEWRLVHGFSEDEEEEG